MATEWTLDSSDGAIKADRYPRNTFRADTVDKCDDGYPLTGSQDIRGRAPQTVVELRVEDLEDTWRMSFSASHAKEGC